MQSPLPRRDDEQAWQGVVNALTGQVCIIDASGVMLAVSGGWQRFGMDNGGREIDVGSNYFTVCGPAAGPDSADAQAFAAGVRSVTAGSAPRFSMERRCGSLPERRWFRVTVARIESSDPLRLVVTHEDLTPVRRAEELATGEAERFRALAALSMDWYWEQDADLRFTRISNGLYPEGLVTNNEFLGRTRREVPGMEWDEAGLVELERLCGARERFRNVELSRVERGALRRVYQLSGEPLYDATGGFLGYRGVGRDVTALRSTESARLQDARRFATVLANLHGAILMVGNDGRVEYANRAFCDMFGLAEAPEALVGTTASATVARIARGYADPTAAVARIRAVVEAGQPVHEEEILLADGRICLRDFVPIEFDGRPHGRLWYHRDVTEQQRSGKALRESQASLEKRVAERTTELTATIAELESMTSVVSHDLRAPLHRMTGFAGLLAMEDEVRQNASALDFTRRIMHAAERMEELINHLLDNARLARTTIEAAAVPLERIVRSYVAELDAMRRERPIEWVIGALPVVVCDPIMARQVVQNLIENAVKYSGRRERPRVEIGAINNSSECGIYVRDNGVGFAMEHADQLFGIFKRLHSESDFPGVGIGLANVRRIMQKHGGRVWFESAPDRGATFFIAFPKPRS